MERVIFIGNCGSGKTTFSKQLSDKTDLPLIHLDIISRGQEYWEGLPGDDFDRILLAELQKPQWIIDGNYNRTISLRLHYCDTVIFFVCLYGVLKCLIKYHGTTRPDMGGNCSEHMDFKFLKSVRDFKKHRKRHYEMLNDSSSDILYSEKRKMFQIF